MKNIHKNKFTKICLGRSKNNQTCMNSNQISITKVCATNNENDQIVQIKFTIKFGNRTMHKDFKDKNNDSIEGTLIFQQTK
jgi:uncharacterized protein YjaZ